MTPGEAIVQLLLRRPFFGASALALAPQPTTKVPRVSVRLEPGPALLYNPAWFEGLSGLHAQGVLVHELLHLLLLHPYRRGRRDLLLWTVACDLAVNEYLSADERFPDAVTCEAVGKDLGRTVSRNQSAEAYYDWLDAIEEPLNLVDGEKEVRLVLKGGQELRAPKDSPSDPSEGEAAAARSLAAELTDRSRSEADEEPGLAVALDQIHGSSNLGWRRVLKRFLTARGTTNPTKTYKRESKRFDDAPGTKRRRGLEALLAIDESGSVSSEQLGAFLKEVAAIRRIAGATVQATRFDTTCSAPVSLNAFSKEIERTRGGGTDFRPVFRLAEEGRFPLLIVFTDGDGPAPDASDQRVLWVLTKGGKAPAPYGHTVTFQE